jgi:hypothetical protein
MLAALGSRCWSGPGGAAAGAECASTALSHSDNRLPSSSSWQSHSSRRKGATRTFGSSIVARRAPADGGAGLVISRHQLLKERSWLVAAAGPHVHVPAWRWQCKMYGISGRRACGASGLVAPYRGLQYLVGDCG